MRDPKRFDPDTRFLLANERTLLAWVRTSITMQAGGLALAHFSSDAIFQKIFSVAIIALGGAMAIFGYVRFNAADRAIRKEELPSIGKAPLFQSVALTLIAVVLIISLIIGLH